MQSNFILNNLLKTITTNNIIELTLKNKKYKFIYNEKLNNSLIFNYYSSFYFFYKHHKVP